MTRVKCGVLKVGWGGVSIGAIGVFGARGVRQRRVRPVRVSERAIPMCLAARPAPARAASRPRRPAPPATTQQPPLTALHTRRARRNQLRFSTYADAYQYKYCTTTYYESHPIQLLFFHTG